MNRRTLSLLFTAVASLFLAGCVQGTISERKTSFSPYTHARVGSETLQDFLTSRTAVLMAGQHLKLTAAETNSGEFSYQASSRGLVLGSAAAVDHRGYFLTAAHCVGQEPTYLLFGRPGQWQVETARLVWRGDVSRGEPDLALLWVPRKLDQVFDWASGFEVGEPVVAVGQNYQPPLDIEIVSFAGTLQASGTGSTTRLGARSIFHTAPLRKADSGGPLADVAGRLIGINVKAGRIFSPLHPLGRRLSLAEHPDLAWLQQLIEGHAAQAKVANQSPNQRIEPMRGSAVTFVLYSVACGALPLMAHPRRCIRHALLPLTNLRDACASGHGGYTAFTLGASMPMNESDWDEFLKRLTEATKQAIRDFAVQHPGEEICYFAYDSEPRYGYVLLCFNTTQDSLRHAQEWHDRHAQRRKELLANPTWFDNAYYQVKAHSVMPFCDNTGDFKYQGFSEFRFPEWEAYAASPDYPAPKDDDDDYLANRVARLFSRAIDQLVEDGSFGALRLASPTLLGFGFHDEDMLIWRFIALPSAAQPGAPPNGGPAAAFGNPGVPEGPPSVS